MKTRLIALYVWAVIMYTFTGILIMIFNNFNRVIWDFKAFIVLSTMISILYLSWKVLMHGVNDKPKINITKAESGTNTHTEFFPKKKGATKEDVELLKKHKKKKLVN